MQYRTTRTVPPVENTSHLKFIPTVIDRGPCEMHGAPVGIPCFHLRGDRGYRPAICNRRAVAAGMDSPISHNAFTVKSVSKSKKRS